MSTENDVARSLRSWLSENRHEDANRVLDTVFDQVPATPQRRSSWPARRLPLMNSNIFRLGVAAAAVVLAVILGISLLPGSGVGSDPTPQPTPEPTAPTVPPEIDTSSWNTFTSAVYGFTVGYPADWRLERRATRPWAVGDGLDFLSPALDTFSSPDGDVAVSVWGVPVDPSPDPTIPISWEDLEAWIETFCETTGNGPCTGIHDRVVPMCPDGDTECHTGAMIVPFQDNVAGYKGGDRGGVTIVVDGVEVTYWVVVSVWQPESFRSLARYGGGTRLIQAFLETMGAQMPSRGPVTHDNHP